MPHLRFESSNNIQESRLRVLKAMAECQSYLVEKLPTQLENCKSRFIQHDTYLLGAEAYDKAFLHLEVKILKGRASELLQQIAYGLKDILAKHFIKSIEKLDFKISVEVCELSDNYAK